MSFAATDFEDPAALCAALRGRQRDVLFFDGGAAEGSWIHGPLIAVEPRLELRVAHEAPPERAQSALAALGRLVARRVRAGGGPGTGVAVLAAYELGRHEVPGLPRLPGLLAWSVDRSVCFLDAVRPQWCSRTKAAPPLLGGGSAAAADGRGPMATGTGVARTSLPREAYLAAVERIRALIAEGEIYQANLCQQFRVPYRGDPYELHRVLRTRHRAPHSAYVETQGFCLVSASPETFVRSREAGWIETWPIKGTRARTAAAETDHAAATELCRSPKDRAELVMIVDLERNDLSRVCRGGSVTWRGIEQRAFSTVHHLVAGVRGRLRPGVDAGQILAATFPGGSVTGAPKVRAMEVLDALEPVRRGFFTGSLMWFGDDGRIDSSILIRTVVLDAERAYIGAGGGIVADSDPCAEWAESNHKARFLAEALGFDPDRAT